MKVAKNITEIYATVNPDEPLLSDDTRFVDLSSARGGEDLVALITRRIMTAISPNYHRRLVTGHRGSGKSTELRRLEASLGKAGFLVSYLDVEQTLDLADFEYLDVLVAIAYQLYESAVQNEIKVNLKLLNSIKDWFGETVLTQEQIKNVQIDIDTKHKIGIEIPLLAGMFAAITGQMRSGSTTRKETRQKLEQRLQDFINRLTELVNDVSARAKKKGFKGLVIIVDSMEKMPLKLLNDQGLTNQSMLFVEHAEQLKILPCHLVATVPVSLVSDRNLGIAFTDIDLIPMVKIASPLQVPWDQGRNLLFEAVAKRAVIKNIFDNEHALYMLIDASGGVVRDLMRLLLFAADYTPINGKITEQSTLQAIRKLVREYDRLIHEEDIPVLQNVIRNPHLPSSVTLSRLMYNRLVLPYCNDETWIGLHPAVKNTPTFSSALGLEVK
jgi:hypothetical protein